MYLVASPTQGLEDSAVLQRHLQTIEEKYNTELKSIEELQVVYSDYERTLENQLCKLLCVWN